MEFGRTVKTTKQQKRVIKKWRIEWFQDEEVRQKYQEALSVEVDGFQGRVRQWKTRVERIRISEGSGSGLERDSQEVKSSGRGKEIGNKVIVCGKAARWWDGEIKKNIWLRRRFIRRLVVAGKINGGSITNYVRKSRN